MLAHVDGRYKSLTPQVLVNFLWCTYDKMENVPQYVLIDLISVKIVFPMRSNYKYGQENYCMKKKINDILYVFCIVLIRIISILGITHRDFSVGSLHPTFCFSWIVLGAWTYQGCIVHYGWNVILEDSSILSFHLSLILRILLEEWSEKQTQFELCSIWMIKNENWSSLLLDQVFFLFYLRKKRKKS